MPIPLVGGRGQAGDHPAAHHETPLARDWFQLFFGQRLIATDSGEYPLLDIRKIEFDAAPKGETTANG